MEKNVKIKQIIRETEDAVTVVFENDEQVRNYTPGQFLNVFHTIDGEEVSRSYSFSSTPECNELPAITIKQIAGGRVSERMVRDLKENDTVRVSRPLGRFEVGAIQSDDHLVFIAGGSGITPLFSLIKFVLANARATVTLLYGSRSYASIIFRERLETLEASYPGQLKVTHFLSGDGRLEPSEKYTHGRITQEKIQQFIAENQFVTSFYLCGPEQMMADLTNYLETAGVESARIRKESFGLTAKGEQDETLDSISEITFRTSEGELKVKQPRSKFILQHALDRGVKLPHSCKEGMCGSCMVKVLSGRIRMTENYALTDKQLAAGYSLLCAGLPETDEVIVSYL